MLKVGLGTAARFTLGTGQPHSAADRGWLVLKVIFGRHAGKVGCGGLVGGV